MPDDTNPDAPVAFSSARGRWIVLAAALGSGVAFLDGSVVNVALPTIRVELASSFAALQWVLDGYLLTLSSLLLVGGALGDRLGRRRVFVAGLALFSLASVGCGLAPTVGVLIGARLVQGMGGALLVPGSLALINSTIRHEDRGRAVGTWAGLAGVASAIGPFLGGWLVDIESWRLVFWINVPITAAAVAITLRQVPERRGTGPTGRLDVGGAASVTAGLAGVTVALIEVPGRGWDALTVAATAVGVIGLAAFPVIERRSRAPLVPLRMFRSKQFAGANLVTLLVYAALSGTTFLLPLQLQQSMGYSALDSGASLLPFTVLMLLLAGRIGALAQRVGARGAMTVGPVVVGVGLALLVRAVPGESYFGGVFPGVLVFGLGMSITVPPLTSTVLAAVPEDNVGAASGTNNAVSRVAGLLAVAVLPVAAGVDTHGSLGPGFGRAVLIGAVLCLVAGFAAFLTVDRSNRAGRTDDQVEVMSAPSS